MSLTVNSTNGNTLQTANATQGNAVTKQSPSIFGDRNGNSKIDREDFTNEQDYQMFEQKGLIGQLWEKAVNFINSLRNRNNSNSISEKAQNDINTLLTWLNKHNIEYKVNDDNSIEFDYDGQHEKHYWDNNNSTTEISRGNGNLLIESINLENNSVDLKTECNNGYKQIVKQDSDGNITTENYRKNDSGKYEATQDFIISYLAEDNFGHIYNGSDIAKIMNQSNYDSDFAKHFWESMSIATENIGTLRGGDLIKLKNGTTIIKTPILDTVKITTSNGSEYYDENGNLITE